MRTTMLISTSAILSSNSLDEEVIAGIENELDNNTSWLRNIGVMIADMSMKMDVDVDGND
jgi:hypothetical protein